MKENKKYNGWANKDTWFVALWLNNDFNNYKRIQNSKHIMPKILKMKKFDFITRLKSFYYGNDKEKIDFNNINTTEIKNVFRELLRGSK